VRELLRTRVRAGLVGRVGFDRRGDQTAAPVTVVRLERPGGATTPQSYEGARVVTVLTPPRELLESAVRLTARRGPRLAAAWRGQATGYSTTQPGGERRERET
jgi:hypothetical protein